jgi:hypothetical protein
MRLAFATVAMFPSGRAEMAWASFEIRLRINFLGRRKKEIVNAKGDRRDGDEVNDGPHRLHRTFPMISARFLM